jgi:hypothetical protein
MSNNNPARSNIYHLQKRIVALTNQYYQAIKNNLTFENIKVIFLKRKKLENELSDLKQKVKSSDNSKKQKMDTSLSL